MRETDEGDNFLTLDLAFTDEEVQESIDDAKANRDQLNLVRNTVPLIGFIVGIPALLVGLFLTARGGGGKRKSATGTTDSEATKAKV